MTLLMVPALMLGTVGAYLVINPAQDKHLFLNYVTVLVVLSLLGALEAGVLTLTWTRERRRRRQVLREQDVLAKRGEFFRQRADGLERDLELLSATRDIYQAANLDEALKEVLQVVKGLAEAEEVAVFLLDDSGQKLFPQARVDVSGSSVGKDIEARPPDDDGVSECFQHQSAFQTVEGNRLRLLVPLAREAEPLGVLAATVQLSGDADGQARQAESALLFLEDIAPHVASVIRTTLLRTQAIYDPLTRLFNRARFNQELDRHVALTRRRGRDLSLVMIDIDHFKQVNDTHGHPVGDEVLATVGRALEENRREYDSIYRYGGEELAVILPETKAKDAKGVAERIRRAVKRLSFSGLDGTSFCVTLSAGVAEFDRKRMTEPKELVALADAALYRAKEGGRDRVVLASSPAAKGPSKKPRRKRQRATKKERS